MEDVQQDLKFDESMSSLEHLWVLLISAGYLKVVSRALSGIDQLSCELRIPNLEVRCFYLGVFSRWLNSLGIRKKSDMIQYLLRGEATLFCEALVLFIQRTLSVREEWAESARYEAFYHGFITSMLGMSLDQFNPMGRLKSNRESGHGYYDLALEPINPHHPVYNKGIILEFKRASSEKQLPQAAQEALAQIKRNVYQTDIVERGVKQVVLIGIAFYKKRLAWACEACSPQLLTIKRAERVSANRFSPSSAMEIADPILAPASRETPSFFMRPTNPSQSPLAFPPPTHQEASEGKAEKVTEGKGVKRPRPGDSEVDGSGGDRCAAEEPEEKRPRQV